MGKDRVEEQKRRKFTRRGRKSGPVADWAQIDGPTTIRAIAAVAFTGGALRFGYSRDGGAFALGIYSEGENHTEFSPDAEDMEDLLRELADWADDLDVSPTPSQGPKKGPPKPMTGTTG